MKLRIPGTAPEHRGRRQKVSEFSGKSRRALLARVNSIDQRATEPGQFVFTTLTYPAAFPTAAASKKHLDTFTKRFERTWGPQWMLWKLEPQKRGAPHFHLLTWMGPGLTAEHVAKLLTWTAQAWHDIAGGGDRHHLKWHLGQLGNRPCVETVKDWQGVASYAGKYLGKITCGDEEWQHPGRYWGERRRDLAPITMKGQDLEERAAVQLRRECVKYFEHQPSPWVYVPGKRWMLKDGRAHDRPGYRLPAKLDLQVTPFERIRVGANLPRLGQIFDVQCRQQRRRWKGRRGGWSGFMPAALLERLAEHVTGQGKPQTSYAEWIARIDGGGGGEAQGAGRSDRASDTAAATVQQNLQSW